MSDDTDGKVDAKKSRASLSKDTDGKVDTEKYHASVVSAVLDSEVASKESMPGLTVYLVGGVVVLFVSACIIDYLNAEKTSIIKLQVRTIISCI